MDAMRNEVFLSRTKDGEKQLICQPCEKEELIYMELIWALDIGFIFIVIAFAISPKQVPGHNPASTKRRLDAAAPK